MCKSIVTKRLHSEKVADHSPRVDSQPVNSGLKGDADVQGMHYPKRIKSTELLVEVDTPLKNGGGGSPVSSSSHTTSASRAFSDGSDEHKVVDAALALDNFKKGRLPWSTNEDFVKFGDDPSAFKERMRQAVVSSAEYFDDSNHYSPFMQYPQPYAFPPPPPQIQGSSYCRFIAESREVLNHNITSIAGSNRLHTTTSDSSFRGEITIDNPSRLSSRPKRDGSGDQSDSKTALKPEGAKRPSSVDGYDSNTGGTGQNSRRCQWSGCSKCAQGATKFCIGHGGGKRCTFPNCHKGARDKFFCAAHGGGKRCSTVGCDKSAVGGSTFCTAHGGGKRCSVPNCGKSSQSSTNFCVKHGGGKSCKVEGCTKASTWHTALLYRI